MITNPDIPYRVSVRLANYQSVTISSPYPYLDDGIT